MDKTYHFCQNHVFLKYTMITIIDYTCLELRNFTIFSINPYQNRLHSKSKHCSYENPEFSLT